MNLIQKRYIDKVLRRFNMHNAKPVSTPLAAHFKLSSALCPKSDADIEYMSRVPIRVKLVHLCMPWFVLVRIYLMHWLILEKSIGEQFSGFSDTCEVLLMLIYSLEKSVMDLLVLLILILLVIRIREEHSQLMFSPLVVVL